MQTRSTTTPGLTVDLADLDYFLGATGHGGPTRAAAAAWAPAAALFPRDTYRPAVQTVGVTEIPHRYFGPSNLRPGRRGHLWTADQHASASCSFWAVPRQRLLPAPWRGACSGCPSRLVLQSRLEPVTRILSSVGSPHQALSLAHPPGSDA